MVLISPYLILNRRCSELMCVTKLKKKRRMYAKLSSIIICFFIIRQIYFTYICPNTNDWIFSRFHFRKSASIHINRLTLSNDRHWSRSTLLVALGNLIPVADATKFEENFAIVNARSTTLLM